MEKEKTAEDKQQRCPVCTKAIDECVCCAECGHDCPLDAGEPYCPVCSPPPPARNG